MSVALPSRLTLSQESILAAELRTSMPQELIALVNSYANEILGGLYGADAWKAWKNVDILDDIPAAPNGDLSKGDRILLYIPRRIRFQGQEQDLTFSVLKIICGGSHYFGRDVLQQFGDDRVPGWVFLDKVLLPGSRETDIHGKKKMAEDLGCSLPHPMEAIILHEMVFVFTDVILWGQGPDTLTQCNRYIEGKPVTVGFCDKDGLRISVMPVYDKDCGVICAKRQTVKE